MKRNKLDRQMEAARESDWKIRTYIRMMHTLGKAHHEAYASADTALMDKLEQSCIDVSELFGVSVNNANLYLAAYFEDWRVHGDYVK
jgi:hypothetical protein